MPFCATVGVVGAKSDRPSAMLMRNILALTEADIEMLKTLDTLLEMTKEAEGLTSGVVQGERLKALIGDIRQVARRECDRLNGHRRQREPVYPTRYQLCMIGVLEEVGFSSSSLTKMTGLEARLQRIHEEIDRSIKELKASRRIM